MLRLLYASQAAPDVAEGQVRDILRSARTHNAAVGLTGVLVHAGGVFMQVLEGPEQEVLRLYVKILDDKRHGNCRLIYVSPARERLFEQWSMGMIEAQPLDFQDLLQLAHTRQATVEPPAYTAALREFLRRLAPGKTAWRA